MPLFIQLREMVRIVFIGCRTDPNNTIPRWAYFSWSRPLFFRYLISPYSFSLSVCLLVSLSLTLCLSLYFSLSLTLSVYTYCTHTLSFSLSLSYFHSLSFFLSLRLRFCHRYIRHPNPILCCWHSPRPGVHASERNRLQRPQTRELPH